MKFLASLLRYLGRAASYKIQNAADCHQAAPGVFSYSSKSVSSGAEQPHEEQILSVQERTLTKYN